MSKLKIKIGALYFNKGTTQVERVIEIMGALVYTSRHKQEAKPYASSNFRTATKKEVDNYLEESGIIKDL